MHYCFNLLATLVFVLFAVPGNAGNPVALSDADAEIIIARYGELVHAIDAMAHDYEKLHFIEKHALNNENHEPHWWGATGASHFLITRALEE